MCYSMVTDIASYAEESIFHRKNKEWKEKQEKNAENVELFFE